MNMLVKIGRFHFVQQGQTYSPPCTTQTSLTPITFAPPHRVNPFDLARPLFVPHLRSFRSGSSISPPSAIRNHIGLSTTNHCFKRQDLDLESHLGLCDNLHFVSCPTGSNLALFARLPPEISLDSLETSVTNPVQGKVSQKG
jgi:hypothetical protein